MSLRSFLYRETRWVRHNAAPLVLVLIVLPALFGGATLAFEQVVPRDTPVGVAPASADVPQDNVDAVTGIATLFSRPRTFEDRAAARRALAREEVYTVFVVPPDLLAGESDATIEMLVQEEMVPYEQPSRAIRSILAGNINRIIETTTVERVTVGEDRSLSEFLVSVAALLLTMVYAFVLLPHVVATERDVYRRVRVSSSLWSLLSAKFATFLVLMLVPIGGVQLIAAHFDLAVTLLDPLAAGVTLLTFLYLGALSVAVMFFFDFSTLGRLVNVTLLFGTLVFSSMVYPAGFFSPLRRTVAKALPTHYSMIVQRGASLKGHGVAMYGDYLAMLVGVTVVAVVVLYASVRYHEWRA